MYRIPDHLSGQVFLDLESRSGHGCPDWWAPSKPDGVNTFTTYEVIGGRRAVRE